MNEARASSLWSGAFRNYAGWVPNVRSHLSFSMIGAGNATALTLPFKAKPSRMVLLHQRRVINDYPFPGWLAARLYPDIALNWVMDAVTAPTEIPITQKGKVESERDRQGMLRGTVQLLGFMEDAGARALQRKALDGVQRLLRSTRVEAKAYPALGKIDRCVGAHQRLLRYLVRSSGPTITLQFALMRTGECRIWYEQQPDHLPDMQLDWLAEQAYYFIKDAVHDHSHHDATSDQITPLYRFGRHPDEVGHNDEIAWRRETLWSLSREIERLNRDGGLTDQRRSLGIIAYAEAFQSTLMGHVRAQYGRQFKTSTSVHDYDFKHLKDSIKANIDVNSTRLAQKIQITIAAVTVFIGGTSLTSSLISLHNNKIASADDKLGAGTLEPLIAVMAINPAFTGLVMMVGLLGCLGWSIFDGPAGIYFRWQRVMSQFGRALSVTMVSSVPGQLFVFLGYHLFIIVLTVLAMSFCIEILIKSFG